MRPFVFRSRGSQYYQRIRGLFTDSLVAYWPLWDPSGTAAEEISNTTANVLFNPGFETAGTGGADIFYFWSETASDGAIADETILVNSGEHAAKLTAGASLATRLVQSFTPLVGITYTFSCMTRGDGTNQGRVQIRDVTHSTNLVLENTGVPGTTYAPYTTSFTVPDGCLSISVTLYNPLAVGGTVYFDDVVLTAPITVKAKNGTYSGAALNQSAGFRHPCISLDGTNDFVNLFSAAIDNSFPRTEGGMICSGKVADASVWTDNTTRYLFRFKGGGLIDAATFGKDNLNRFIWQYNAHGIDRTITSDQTTTDKFCMGLTWSLSGNYLRAYLNGRQVGTDETIGEFLESLSSGRALIGAENSSAPSSCWRGWVSDAILVGRPITAGEFVAAANI